MKNPGKLVRYFTEANIEKIGIAYDKDQVPEVSKFNKVLIVCVKDKLNHTPTGNKTIKHVGQIQIIGYVD